MAEPKFNASAWIDAFDAVQGVVAAAVSAVADSVAGVASVKLRAGA